MERTDASRVSPTVRDTPHENGHHISKNPQQIESQLDVQAYSTCSNYLPRPALEQQLYSSFDTAAQNHGVLHNRVLLWSVSGTGKRQLAINFAYRFAVENDRKIFWVEGRSVDTFIRDYARAYQQLTGEEPPYGILLAAMLQKIKRTLESRFQEWFMVVLDFQYFLEEIENECGLSLAAFIPDRGQVLITTSCMLIANNPDPSDSNQKPTSAPGLKLSSSCTRIIKVCDLGNDEIEQMTQHRGLRLQKRSKFVSRVSPIFVNALVAGSRIVDIPLPIFLRSFKARFAEAGCPVGESDTSMTVHSELHVAFNLIWQIINEHDTWALHLLCALCAVDRLAIPVALLQSLPTFRDSISDNFLPALDFLEDAGVIQAVSTNQERKTIDMHLLAHRFFRSKFKSHSPDLIAIVLREWTEVLDNRLAEYSKPDLAACWALLPHLCGLFHSAVTHTQPSLNYYSLVIKTSYFLVQQGNLPNLAGSFTTQAINSCISQWASSNHIPKDYNLSIVEMKYIRARALMQLGKYQQALVDLNDAKTRVSSIKISTEKRRFLEAEILDTEALILGFQLRYSDAQKLLERVSPETPPNEPNRKAFRNFFLARCIADQKDGGKAKITQALKYSHTAVSYWSTLPGGDKWICHVDSSPLRWIERHVGYLVAMQKYKGALLFLPEILDHYIEHYDIDSSSVFRNLWVSMKCYTAIDDIRGAEDAICRVLELGGLDGLDLDSLTWLLEALSQMAAHLNRNGRTVEAEAICRWNLKTAETRQVIYPGDTVPCPSTSDWFQLVWCLMLQGKDEEARFIRDKYQNETNDEASVDSILSVHRKLYNRSRKLYMDRLDVQKQGDDMRWRIDYDDNSDFWALKLGIKQWGTVTRRERENRDFESDVDTFGIRRARKSRLLRLLGFNLVYLSFVEDCFEDGQRVIHEEIWTPFQRQSILGEFWNWCDCRRKRNRSSSISPIDLIRRRATKYNQYLSELEEAESMMTQKSITDYFGVLPRPLYKVVPGCGPECPCVTANQEGQRAYLSLLEKIKPYQAEKKRKRKPRYLRKDSERIPTGPEPSMTFTIDKDKNLNWVPEIFEYGDHDDEVYIVPNAVNIPSIKITFPQEEQDLKVIGDESEQTKIRTYFLRDTTSLKDRDTIVEEPMVLELIPEEEGNSDEAIEGDAESPVSSESPNERRGCSMIQQVF